MGKGTIEVKWIVENRGQLKKKGEIEEKGAVEGLDATEENEVGVRMCLKCKINPIGLGYIMNIGNSCANVLIKSAQSLSAQIVDMLAA